jgi:protein subunit release factor A
MKYLVEVRASEGGEDSKLLVEDQFVVYMRIVKSHCL